MRASLFTDLFFVCLIGSLVAGFVCYGELFLQSSTEPIDLSLSSLPKYTFFSLARGLIAYVCSLVFSLAWGIWAGKDRVIEKITIPLLDLLQSIPVLGFMPGLIIFFVWAFPGKNIGLELAAILMIFTSQAWNMAFGVYQSVRMIPKDKIESSLLYKFSRWQRIKWLEVPSTIISLVWNSIVGVAGGWFFLMASETFQLGSKDFRLPGLGSYMSMAVDKGDLYAMSFAIIAMLCIIIFLDQLLWRPLIVWSEKFRLENTSSYTPSNSWFLTLLKRSYLLKKALSACSFMRRRTKKKTIRVRRSFPFRYCFLAVLLYFVFVGVMHLISFLMQVSLLQWHHLISLMMMTLMRVLFCVVISLLWALPLGLFIGLSKKLCKRIEPLLQIAASFPATLLFPALIWFFVKTGVSLSAGCVVLMLMGTGWYILFNVIAGAQAIPSEIKEATGSFRLLPFQKISRVYLPAVFPYLITGLVTACGGAWNASIVAEYVSYKGQRVMIPGLGSEISFAAEQGDLTLLAAAVVVMMVVVVLMNYSIWLRLYRYAEKRFSFNY